MKKVLLLFSIILMALFSGCINSGNNEDAQYDGNIKELMLTADELSILGANVNEFYDEAAADDYIKWGAKEIVFLQIYDKNNLAFGLQSISRFDINRINEKFNDSIDNTRHNYRGDPTYKELDLSQIGDASFSCKIATLYDENEFMYNIAFIKKDIMVDIYLIDDSDVDLQFNWGDDIESIIISLAQITSDKIV